MKHFTYHELEQEIKKSFGLQSFSISKDYQDLRTHIDGFFFKIEKGMSLNEMEQELFNEVISDEQCYIEDIKLILIVLCRKGLIEEGSYAVS